MHVVDTEALFRKLLLQFLSFCGQTAHFTALGHRPHLRTPSTTLHSFSVYSGAAANSVATKSRKSPLAYSFRVQREVFSVYLLLMMGIQSYIKKYIVQYCLLLALFQTTTATIHVTTHCQIYL